ncbi:MAG: DNA/RNA nuclease SfsA [Thermoplasmatota archaeon]
MKFPFEEPLHPGRLRLREKRFLAHVTFDDGQEVTAHCPNSGSMLGMAQPGSEVMLRHVPDPKRKLQWTWELVRPPGQDAWVGCNTARPNQVVRWAIETDQIPGLSAADGLRPEQKYGENSRIDLLLGTPETGLTYVEVKNTTLARAADAPKAPHGRQWKTAKQVHAGYPVGHGPGPHIATFPDAVTARGAKHMEELAAMVEAGHEAAVVLFVNRSDCDRFDVARDIDPDYAVALERARDVGVRVIPLGMTVDPSGWQVRSVLPSV